MSDRRPENRPLFAGCPTHPEHADRKHDYMGNVSNYGDPCSFQIEPATFADLLAAVRRGVESGTIKGEMRQEGPSRCKHGEVTMHVYNFGETACAGPIAEKRWVLVIPVSDGGSET